MAGPFRDRKTDADRVAGTGPTALPNSIRSCSGDRSWRCRGRSARPGRRQRVPGIPNHDRHDAGGGTIPARRGVQKTRTTTPWSSPLRAMNAGWPIWTAPGRPERSGAGRVGDRGCARPPITSAHTRLILTGSTGRCETTGIATIVAWICPRGRTGSAIEGPDGGRSRQGLEPRRSRGPSR